jgi:endonuclease/exonuclease/phosphatase family metal-dependent hydrolase
MHLPGARTGSVSSAFHQRDLRRLASRFKDAQRVLQPARRHATFPTRAPFRCIDHVFVNHRIDVLAASAICTPLARVASDHLPLVVDFRIAESIEAGMPGGKIGQVDGGGT